MVGRGTAAREVAQPVRVVGALDASQALAISASAFSRRRLFFALALATEQDVQAALGLQHPPGVTETLNEPAQGVRVGRVLDLFPAMLSGEGRAGEGGPLCGIAASCWFLAGSARVGPRGDWRAGRSPALLLLCFHLIELLAHQLGDKGRSDTAPGTP